MTKISELKVAQGKVDIQAKIINVEDVRTFNKDGREMKVASAIIEDDSGQIKLSLWNDDAEKFKAGETIKITNGYVSEFKGEKQISSGKFGKIEKVSESESSSESEETSEDIDY